MRRLHRLSLLALLFAPLVFASQQYLGVIASTNAASKNNTNTAGNFPLPLSLAFVVQCDQAAWVETHCKDATCVAVANQSRLLQQYEPWPDSQSPNEQNIATLCASAATCNCWVSARFVGP